MRYVIILLLSSINTFGWSNYSGRFSYSIYDSFKFLIVNSLEKINDLVILLLIILFALSTLILEYKKIIRKEIIKK